MPTTSLSTTLLESVNIVLANLGESPVNSLSGGALPQQVSLALNTIEEVSTDIQSKGWWFNQKTGSNYDTTANVVIYPSSTNNNWSSDIPEEARRYITIRASRIAQTRLIGSEELQKFSYNEELVSLAILQQAHVRNSNGTLDFNSFPAELRGLGMDEVMFLQGNVEEKIGTLRLGGELANIAKTKAETDLIANQEALVAYQAATELKSALKTVAETSLINDQEALVTKQALTEVQNALKVIAETSLINDQEALVVKQALTEVAKATDIGADTTIKGKQGSLIDKQALTEIQNALKVVAETSLLGEQEDLVEAQALDVAADTTLKGKQGSLVDAQATDVAADTTLKGKQGSLVDAQTTDVAADTTLKGKQGSLVDAQTTDVAADTTLKGKQGSLVDAQATDVAADTTLKGKQGSLVDAQATDVAADTTLKGKQGSLVDAQATDVAADTTLKGKQGSLVDAQATDVAADTTLKGKQGSLVDAQATDVAADTTLKGKQGSLVDAQATDVAADTTLKGKQGSLVDAQATDVAADTTLKGKQGSLVDAQATDVAADTTLKGKQGSLVDAQATDVAADTTLKGKQGTALDADTALKTSQKTQLDAQTAIEATAEKAFYDGVVAGTQETYRDYAAEMRMMGIQESGISVRGEIPFQQTPAYKKVEMLKDAAKLRLVTATETGTDATELSEVNKIMRFIGEPPVTALNDNSLASECVRLLRDTDTELQGRGWYFNIDEDGVIVPKALGDTPQKYREYLSVRVAILLTELYPQSGVDIQRLPKMEAELRAYFKDREFDDANYSIFDSYDVASRIGINRNYDLI